LQRPYILIGRAFFFDRKSRNVKLANADPGIALNRQYDADM